jgi:hypothetical protein
MGLVMVCSRNHSARDPAQYGHRCAAGRLDAADKLVRVPHGHLVAIPDAHQDHKTPAEIVALSTPSPSATRLPDKEGNV